MPVFLSLPDLVRVVAVADVCPENRELVGAQLGVPPEHRYADYRALLEQGDLDAVSIATPHHLHAEQAIAAAETGVAVISEKPMASSLTEADAILAAVQRSGVPYTVVHNFLFSLPMQAALAELQTNLGRPLFGRAQSLFLKPADFATSQSSPSQVWRAQRAAGGGCAIDTAYHELYTVERLVGSPVRYVEARVTTVRFSIDVDDLAILLLEHENGVVSTVSAAWCVPALEGGRWCEVHTAEGSIRVHHRSRDPVLRFRQGVGWEPLPVPGLAEAAERLPTEVSGHRGFFAQVFAALRAGEPLPVTGEMARHNLAIIEAARQATAERRAVRVEL